MYETLLAIHIIAAILWIGGGVTVHLFGRMALAGGNGPQIVEFTRQANLIGPRFYAPASLILVVVGVLLVDEAGYEMGQTWVTLGLAGWVVSFLIGILFYGRQDKKLQAVAAAEGPDSPKIRGILDRVMLVNLAEIIILLLVVVDMAVKPGL